MIEEYKKNLDKLKDGDQQMADWKKKMADWKNKLDDAKVDKKKHDKTLREAKIIKQQSELLEEYATAIKKNRVLKQASFWQQILKYIFYVIFIFNVFITGFGLASSPRVVVLNAITTNPPI